MTPEQEAVLQEELGELFGTTDELSKTRRHRLNLSNVTSPKKAAKQRLK